MAYSNYSFVLAILSFVGLSIQQCNVAIGDSGGALNGSISDAMCYVDPVFGTNFEYMLYIDAASGQGCPSSVLNFGMTATYTGADQGITTQTSPETVTITLPGTTTMFYEFGIPYSSMLNGGVVTVLAVLTSIEPDGQTAFTVPIQLGGYSITDALTIVNTVATSTITTETDVPSVSVSVITVDATSTITPPAFTTESGTATKTVYNPEKTSTKVITVTPPPRTIKKNEIVTKTKVVTCIPSKPNGKRSLSERGQVPGSPEVPLCLPPGSGPPPTTTVVVGTSLVTVPSIHYDVSVELATSTSVIDVTAPTPTVYNGASTTTTVQKDKPQKTTTQFVLGNRHTTYVTSTYYITTTVLPKGNKTPPCTRLVPDSRGKPKTIQLGHQN